VRVGRSAGGESMSVTVSTAVRAPIRASGAVQARGRALLVRGTRADGPAARAPRPRACGVVSVRRRSWWAGTASRAWA